MKVFCDQYHSSALGAGTTIQVFVLVYVEQGFETGPLPFKLLLSFLRCYAQRSEYSSSPSCDINNTTVQSQDPCATIGGSFGAALSLCRNHPESIGNWPLYSNDGPFAESLFNIIYFACDAPHSCRHRPVLCFDEYYKFHHRQWTDLHTRPCDY